MSIASIRPTRCDPTDVLLFEGDLDERAFERALGTTALAWDDETTGLDWQRDRLATVQIQVYEATFVVRLDGRVPVRLKALLEDPTILKVMHHAMFDLRFLRHHWDVAFKHVVCTKIASKLLSPEAPPSTHSLGSLVEHHFGVQLDKSQRLTDWLSEDLSASQLRYAADDVRFLLPLYERLDRQLRHKGLAGLRDRCYAHLPTRVELELNGYSDVFAY